MRWLPLIDGEDAQKQDISPSYAVVRYYESRKMCNEYFIRLLIYKKNF